MDVASSSNAAGMMRVATEQFADRANQVVRRAEIDRLASREQMRQQLLGALSPEVSQRLDVQA